MEDDMTMDEAEAYKESLNKISRNIVDMYEEANILYVPFPVFSEEELLKLMGEAKERTDFIIDFNIELGDQEPN